MPSEKNKNHVHGPECAHGHAHHEHCHHDHDEDDEAEFERFSRVPLSVEERKAALSQPLELLIERIVDFKNKNLFGVAAPLQEVLIQRFVAQNHIQLPRAFCDLAHMALEIGEYEYARILLDKAEACCLGSRDHDTSLLCEILFWRSEMYDLIGEKEDRYKTLELGLERIDKVGFDPWQIHFRHALGEFFLVEKNYDSAKKLITEALELASKHSLEQEKNDLRETLAEVNKKVLSSKLKAGL